MAMKTKYKYVSCYGGLWRLTQKKWREYLKAAAQCHILDLSDYGVQLTPEIINVTDFTAEDARLALNSAQ